ncbi:MAG: hypothetical protein KKG59_06340 [Nanoarchaeota archaeon]|nr:hypothetical protein [Nanoarchaeota archaeon]
MTAKGEKIHQEILEEAINDESSPRDHRFIIVIISILIILGMILAFTGGGRIVSFVQGRFASSTVEDVTLITKQGQIVILGDVYKELLDQYKKNQAHEWAACLIGTRNNDTIEIDDLYVPRIYDKSVYSVRSERCPQETIITLHSHPENHCVFSLQDLESYDDFLLINPDALTAIMCGKDRFTVYSEELFNS